MSKQLLLAYSWKLFTDEHINEACAAKARPHRDNPLRLSLHFADNAGIASVSFIISLPREPSGAGRVRVKESFNSPDS